MTLFSKYLFINLLPRITGTPVIEIFQLSSSVFCVLVFA